MDQFNIWRRFSEQEAKGLSRNNSTAAGYKAGGRVGFKFGGIDAALDKVEDESIKESLRW